MSAVEETTTALEQTNITAEVEVVFEGKLQKQGKGAFGKGLKERYIIIHSNGLVEYYTEKDGAKKGSFTLQDDATLTVTLETSSDDGDEWLNPIVVKTDGRDWKFVLSAEDQNAEGVQKLQEWTTAFLRGAVDPAWLKQAKKGVSFTKFNKGGGKKKATIKVTDKKVSWGSGAKVEKITEVTFGGDTEVLKAIDAEKDEAFNALLCFSIHVDGHTVDFQAEDEDQVEHFGTNLRNHVAHIAQIKAFKAASKAAKSGDNKAAAKETAEEQE